MTKKMWDTYAPIYEQAMRSDKRIYQFMCEKIPEAIRNKDVLDFRQGDGSPDHTDVCRVRREDRRTGKKESG